MTIAAAYLTSNGVVLGADSTTTVKKGAGVSQLLHHAQKVFEIGEHGRMGICTYGAGNVCGTSHRTLVGRLGDWLNEQTVQEAAQQLLSMVMDATDDGKRMSEVVGYFLGGWNVGSRAPVCCNVVVRDQHVTVNELTCGEARFSGQPRIFDRVFRGFDPQLPDRLFRALLEELKPDFHERIPPQTLADRFGEAFAKAASGLEVAGYTDLPIREAIDYIYSYLHVTIKAFKFRAGPPPCGGPIEVAFITTDRRFRWAIHKDFATAVMVQAPRSH